MGRDEKDEEDMYAWRSMVRLPADWGAEVDVMARAKALPRAIMLRLLIREGLDQMHREARQKAERERGSGQ